MIRFTTAKTLCKDEKAAPGSGNRCRICGHNARRDDDRTPWMISHSMAFCLECAVEDAGGLPQEHPVRRAITFLKQKPAEVHIAINGVWSAKMADGSGVASYEKLDYHNGAREYLEYLRDAGIPIIEHGDVKL